MSEEAERMINMIEKNGIISMYIHEKKSKREISRVLDISRNTVDKYVKDYKACLIDLKESGTTYESRIYQEKLYGKPKYERQVPNRSVFIGKMKDIFDELIEKDRIRDEQLGPNKQKLTAAKIFRVLKERGFQVSQSTVERAFNHYKDSLPKEVFIRQEYDPGQRAEYDFHHVKTMIDGVKKTYHQVTIAMPNSDYLWARLYHDETRTTLIKSIIDFIEYSGGIFEEMVFDNLSPLVKRYAFQRKEKIYDEELIKLSTYYGFSITTCNARSGWEKGSVENGGKFVRKELFSLEYSFDSEDELMAYVESSIEKINKDKLQAYELERKALKKNDLPRYVYAKEGLSIVNVYSMTTIDNNHYSVPERLVGKAVNYVKTTDCVAIYDGSTPVAKHPLLFGKGNYSTDFKHYEKTLKKKPGAIQNSVLLKGAKSEVKRYYEAFCKEDPKKFLEHIYGGQIKKPKDEVMDDILMRQLSIFNQLIPEVTSFGKD